jgi:2-phosphosulfolactate phosphatase
MTAAASCDEVVLASLLNLDAVVRTLLDRGEDAVVLCAGFKGGFALDDAYCAGRIVRLLDAARTDAAVACALVAEAFPKAIDGLNARTYGPPGLEEDIAFCAQENLLEAVPRFSRMVGTAAEITGS